MKRLPIGIQDFKYMIENNYIYIDKTKYLYMLKDSGKFYFMSRPRRFGKSLTISTFDYMFRGEKELFKGTWLYDNWHFEPQPVIRLSMNELDTRDEKTVEEGIFEFIDELYEKNGLEKTTHLLKTAFRRLIEGLYDKYGKRVVVLVDEYDKPILDHLNNPEMAEKIRNVLRMFYSTLKSSDAYLDFVFMTGITKFTKVGVFSTLNNLQDISVNEKYSQMFGYTKEELETSFNDYVQRGLTEKKLNRDAFFQEIKEQYNGFSFDGESFVYNPFSILNYFESFRLKNYWVESGSPSFIVKYAQTHDVRPNTFLGNYIQEDILTTYEIETAPPVSFLLQAGYLTFKDYKKDYGYLIDYPNKEVRDSFSKLLLVSEYKLQSEEANTIRKNIVESLEKRDFELLYNQMQRTLSNIPYTLFEPRKPYETDDQYIVRREGFYHSVILTMFWAAGVNVKAEELTALGRSDLILEYENDMYILELKKQAPEKSLNQIREKNYVGKYDLKKNNLYFVGIEIDDEKKNLSRYKLEQPDA